jgi:hypothetical protein
MRKFIKVWGYAMNMQDQLDSYKLPADHWEMKFLKYPHEQIKQKKKSAKFPLENNKILLR